MADTAPPDPTIAVRSLVGEFVRIAGADTWAARLHHLRGLSAPRTREARDLQQRHAIELAIGRMLDSAPKRPPSPAEQGLADLAADAVQLHATLRASGQRRLTALLSQALTAGHSLVPVFHLLRTAALQRSRGFDVAFAGLAEDAPFDLLLWRDRTEAELACDVTSAEDGHGLHRGAWFRLVDRIDPELQTWLRAHPGRYILKLTFPLGLKAPASPDNGLLGALHARISQMLAEQRRADSDEAAILRLDPLLLAAAQADELGLLPRLRQEFGPEAHLAVTAAGGGVFVMAARAGQQNEVACAIRRRMQAIVTSRLTGTRPGILAMFIEDIDRAEWRHLREQLELEGEVRQFLTQAAARSVVAVTCASRCELFGLPVPDAAPDGEMRFRNPAHPAAKAPALAPAVLSSV